MKKTLLLALGLFFSSNAFSVTAAESDLMVFEEEPLLRVYRNPNNQFTRIEFWQEEAGKVNVDVINAAGILIERMPKSYTKEGLKIVELDTRYFRSGVYFVRVKSATMKFLIA